MPELPEVETVRRGIEPILLGQTIERVQIRRPDIVRLSPNQTPTPSRPSQRQRAAALLAGKTVQSLERLGKQLLIVADSGQCVCVHLGMSGSLRSPPHISPGKPKSATGTGRSSKPSHRTNLSRSSRSHLSPHTHIVWHLTNGHRVMFTDPRRFGGIWTYPDHATLIANRWSKLGPDALVATPAQIRPKLQRTTRPIKAVLLDQSVVAGLGNIYVDETLFTARIHPLTPANLLSSLQIRKMVTAWHHILAQAIKAGGSTLRDYVNATGDPGWFQIQHQVYSRAGQPCVRCKRPLDKLTVAARTTVCCTKCQPMKFRRGSD